MNLALAALMAYSVVIIAIGLYLSRRIARADDFLIAGRTLGPGLLAGTLLAANIGAGSTVGATGLGYKYGFSAWWWVGCAGIGSLVLANVVGPRIWALAKEHGWRTVGDFLEYRYSRTIRGLIAVLLWLGALMILAGQLIAISQILAVVIGLPKWQGCVIGGIVVGAYFSSGGLLSSVWVNLIQLTVKLTGFAIAVPFAVTAVGGWPAVRHVAESAPSLGGLGVLSYIAFLVPSFIVSPGIVQKVFGARDVRALRVGVNVNALVLLVFAFAPVILGLVARARFPGIADQDAVLPTLMTRLMPAWLGFLTLAAVFSAELSASDAVLFMLSSSLSVDLYKTFIRHEAADRDLLLVSRSTAVIGAVCGVLLAIILPSVIGALQIFYTLMAVALAAPLIVGLYSKRPNARRATVAIVTSVIATAATRSAPLGIAVGFAIMLFP